jgi:phenylpropionate dioxygenase-like ring-hydroxylating dioxygenase large terminal subunit
MDPMPDVTRFFHPVLPSRRLEKKPVRVQLAGRSYALFRDHTGRAAALRDRCPHRFAPLSAGRVRPDGRLACPYHGWNFDAEGRGCSPSQPTLTKCDVESFQVREQHGYLWLAARATPENAFPQMEFEGYSFAGSFSQLFRAPLHVALDNFSEDEHTPWVHHRLGWNEAQAGAVQFHSERKGDRIETHYAAPQRASMLMPLLAVHDGDTFHNDWVTHFDPVRIDYVLSWRDRAGALRPFSPRALIFMVPETARTTRFHVFAFVKINAPRMAWMLPLVKRAALALGWLEVRDDARFIPLVADTPFDMRGMRLGRFDKPLALNRTLLRTHYWGERPGAVPELRLVGEAD